MNARIEIARTPNPDALKFVIPGRLVAGGPYEYAAGSDVSGSPLAARLLAVDGVAMVMIAPEFVTVQRGEPAWDALAPRIVEALHEFLGGYELAVLEDGIDGPAPVAVRTEVERRIVALLDEYVRPAVAEDGGEVRYLGFEEGVVRLSLRGACGTCPSSASTLRMGVERLLVENVPEVSAVENVV